MRTMHKWGLFAFCMGFAILIVITQQTRIVAARDNTASRSPSATELSKYRELKHVRIMFLKPVPAPQIVSILSSSKLNVEYFLYTWGEHKGWYFPKGDVTPHDALLDFENSHKQFLNVHIQRVKQMLNGGNYDSSVESMSLNKSRTALLLSFEEQKNYIDSNGMILSGISLIGEADEINVFLNRNLPIIKSHDTETKNRSNFVDVGLNESPAINGNIAADAIQTNTNSPYPDNPWKFVPQHGVIAYSANDKYFRSTFYWRDTSGFTSIHNAYEHDIVVTSPIDQYVGPDRSGKTYYSNLPGAYIDTQFMDELSLFTIGSSQADQIQTYTEYYSDVPVEVFDSSKGPYLGDVQPQLSSWAGKYDDGEDPPEWQEAAFCTANLQKPEWCIFADQTFNKMKFYNTSGVFSYFPFKHDQDVPDYVWDQNYNPNQFSCPVGQFRGEYSYGGEFIFARCDGTSINRDWGVGGPGNGVGTDNFNVAWTGRFNFSAGDYTFTVRADDGVRLYVDGTSVIDEWRDQPPTTFQQTRSVGAGEHEVKVEYYERGGGAVVQVNWQPSGCSVGQYHAQYYNNNSLAGSPTLTRCENNINNEWDSGGPGNGIANDNFSARWTGRFNFSAGNYTFTARTDDGMRVYVDGQVIINAWWPQPPTIHQGSRYLDAGEHEVKVEYNEYGGGATAQLTWQQGSCPAITAWKGEYWNNNSFSGSPVLCRDDSNVSFNWGSGSPDPSRVPSDNFSARWTRTLNFASGRYRFHLAGDDGLRLWIDGNLVIDKWIYQARTEYTADVDLSTSSHTLKVEYFEGGGDANVSLWWEGPFNPPATIDPNKIYRIIAVHSGKGLDVGGASQTDGAKVQQWVYAGGSNQKWRFEPTGDGYYMIRAIHSNKCLDVAGASPNNGTLVQQWSCAGANNQRWQVATNGDAFIIRAKHSGKVLDVSGASQENGAQIIQWDFGGGNNQRWRIEVVQ